MTREELIAEINHAADLVARVHLEHDTEEGRRTGAGVGVDLRRAGNDDMLISWVMDGASGRATAEGIADMLLDRQWHDSEG